MCVRVCVGVSIVYLRIQHLLWRHKILMVVANTQKKNRLNTMLLLFTSALFNKINWNAAIFYMVFPYIHVLQYTIYLYILHGAAIINEENGMKRTNYWFWIHFRDLNTFNGISCWVRNTFKRRHDAVARIFKLGCFTRFNYKIGENL